EEPDFPAVRMIQMDIAILGKVECQRHDQSADDECQPDPFDEVKNGIESLDNMGRAMMRQIAEKWRKRASRRIVLFQRHDAHLRAAGEQHRRMRTVCMEIGMESKKILCLNPTGGN